jgi:hypothetical protein
MHTKKTAIALLICMASLPALMAQSTLDEQSGNSKNDPASSGTDQHKMNIVKLNLLPALFIKNFSVQYERVISKHFSVALGLRFMPNSGIPFKDNIISIADITDPDASKAINNFKMSNFALTPEMRFYLGRKGYGRGFYIAPYYRYASFQSDDLPIGYTDDSNQQQTITLRGDIKTHSGGLMFGAQWFLGNAVTLDWWIIGAHYGANKGNFSGTTSSPLSAQEQANLQATLNDFSLPVGTITSVVTANGATVNLSGPWAGVRGGLTLGIRF